MLPISRRHPQLSVPGGDQRRATAHSAMTQPVHSASLYRPGLGTRRWEATSAEARVSRTVLRTAGKFQLTQVLVEFAALPCPKSRHSPHQLSARHTPKGGREQLSPARTADHSEASSSSEHEELSVGLSLPLKLVEDQLRPCLSVRRVRRSLPRCLGLKQPLATGAEVDRGKIRRLELA